VKNLILPILLLFTCSVFPNYSRAQTSKGFIFHDSAKISVRSVSKINNQWDTIQANGTLDYSGIVNCKKSQILEPYFGLRFDTVEVRTQKVLPSLQFAKFEIKASALSGIGALGLFQLNENLEFKSFIPFALTLQQQFGYFDKFRGAILGGLTFVLFTTDK